MPGSWKPFRVKVLECVIMTRDDAFAFSEALRGAFPRIRFLREDYADKFIDYPAWRQACGKAAVGGRMMPRRYDFACLPKDEGPDYFPSLADVLEKNFYVWVEPPNWRPRWRRRKRSDLLVIENIPRLNFTFRRGGFSCPDPRRHDGLHGNPHLPTHNLDLQPGAIDNREPIVLEGHRMLGGWDKGDDVARAFVHKVWRILGMMSTNRLIAIDPHSLHPIPPDGSASTVSYVRAANDALRWARGRRHNYLAWSNHWYKPERYFDWLLPEDDDESNPVRPLYRRGAMPRRVRR
jgi:hypothetical protein